MFMIVLAIIHCTKHPLTISMPSHAFDINKTRLIRFGSKVSLIDRPQHIVRDTIIHSENAYYN